MTSTLSAEAVGTTGEQAWRSFADAMNRAQPGEYVYTREQLAAALERGSAVADSLAMAGRGVAQKLVEREAMGIPVIR